RRAAHRSARPWPWYTEGRPPADLREVLSWPERERHPWLRAWSRYRAVARHAPRRNARLRREPRRRRGLRDLAAARHAVKVLIVDDEPDVRALEIGRARVGQEGQ